MNRYVTKEEMTKRYRKLALEISIENIDACIHTLQKIKRIINGEKEEKETRGK